MLMELTVTTLYAKQRKKEVAESALKLNQNVNTQQKSAFQHNSRTIVTDRP